jgi:phage baseplate assembly protein W
VNDDFLGTGWQFPIALDTDHQIAKTHHEESISQAIWMILATAPGERVMRPDFGCGIHDLIFAVNSAGTAGQVAALVRQALVQWEPRIDVLEVTAVPDAAEPSLLLIEITYQVRTTNSRFNLVYPFYLE